MADETLRELAPLLAEEGINLDDPDGLEVPDTETLQRAMDGAFRSLDSLIARHGSLSVLYGSALVLAAALQAWARQAHALMPELLHQTLR